MESQLNVQYRHRLEGHFAVGNVDTEFYKTLTGVREVYINPETGEPEIPLPSTEQVLTVIGTTSLSSARVASLIRLWLHSRRAKITISVFRGRKIEFEGPNLDRDVESIKEMIDKVVDEESTREVSIHAEHIPP